MDGPELSLEWRIDSEPVVFHLREALADLEGLVRELEDADVDSEDFKISMAHLYHHINSAWNSRLIKSLDDPQLQERFMELARFPADITAWGEETD